MFAWYTGKDIVQPLQVQSSKIARTVECIKIAVQYRIAPQCFVRNADTTLCRGSQHRHEIQFIRHRLEGLMAQNRIHAFLAIPKEKRHFILGITFWYKCKIYTITAVARLADILPLISLGCRTDKDILWKHTMGTAGTHFPMIIGKLNSDIHHVFWHRQQKNILK